MKSYTLQRSGADFGYEIPPLRRMALTVISDFTDKIKYVERSRFPPVPVYYSRFVSRTVMITGSIQ